MQLSTSEQLSIEIIGIGPLSRSELVQQGTSLINDALVEESHVLKSETQNVVNRLIGLGVVGVTGSQHDKLVVLDTIIP